MAPLAVLLVVLTALVPAAVSAPLPVRQEAADGTPQVLAISVDALNPQALRLLGAERTPTLHRLLRQGAGTLNARSQVEQSVTLPNHTSMVTGRRIDADRGGHGVTFNTGSARTVQQAAGHAVASVFSAVHAAGGSSALFSTKGKFRIFPRSWRGSIDRTMITAQRDATLVDALVPDLVRRDRDFTLLHLGAPDAAGHASGFLGELYLAEVVRIDRLLGRILAAADARPELDDLTILLTADHGGCRNRTDHSDASRLCNVRVPFLAWGAGVRTGGLYDRNPRLRAPGRRVVGYGGRQPVRNGAVANTALALLGIDPLRGSKYSALRLS